MSFLLSFLILKTVWLILNYQLSIQQSHIYRLLDRPRVAGYYCPARESQGRFD